MSLGPFTRWLREQFAATPNVPATKVAELANGLNEGYLSALRSGRQARPSERKAEALARAFAQLRGLSADETNGLIAAAIAAAKETPTNVDVSSSSAAGANVPTSSTPSWDQLFFVYQRAAAGKR